MLNKHKDIMYPPIEDNSVSGFFIRFFHDKVILYLVKTIYLYKYKEIIYIDRNQGESKMSFYIRPLSEVKEDYNFLMGYTTGKPKEWWCGVEGITHIFNGAWSDPEIGFHGYAINENDVIDLVYSMMEEDYGEEKAKEIFDNGSKYMDYIKDHVEEIKDTLDEWIDNYENTMGIFMIESYHDKELRGLSDSFKTTDFEKAKDMAHEYLSKGGYVKMTYQKMDMAKEHILDADSYFENFEGEFPLSLEDFEEEDNEKEQEER